MLKLVKNVRSRLLASTATAFVAALAMGGTAAAITDSQFLYSSTKSGYFTIHAMALAPDAQTAQYGNEYELGTLRDDNNNCYSTGVNLPQGARITQLAVWYSSPASTDPLVFFPRNSLVDGSSISLITSGVIADDSDTRKLAILPIAGGSSLVSNIGFSYGFGFCPGAGGTFRGARITYTYTSAGD